MNSKERFLAAVRCQPVDHPPLYLRLWSMGEGEDQIPFRWRDPLARAQALLDLGVDDTLLLEPPLGYTESYAMDQVSGLTSERTLEPPADGSPYPVLRKRYHTPAGPLSVAVKRSADWPFGDNIPLFDDFNVARFLEPPVKSFQDLPRLRFLLADPTPEQMDEFWLRARRLRQAADRLGVPLDGGWTALGDSAVWLCGMQAVLYGQMDQPALLEALLDILLEWELKRVDWLLQAGVDEIVHMAWYEGADFWTPKNYRRMLRPRLQQIIDRAHAAGIPFRYIITRGWKPLSRDLLEMGVDCLTGVDPVQDKIDLAEAKRTLGGRICLMGGINAAVTLAQAGEAEIGRAVQEAMRLLAPGGGFILYPVDAVFSDMPWARTQLLIDRWRTCWQNKEVANFS